MTSGQEMERVYSYNPEAARGLPLGNIAHVITYRSVQQFHGTDSVVSLLEVDESVVLDLFHSFHLAVLLEYLAKLVLGHGRLEISDVQHFHLDIECTHTPFFSAGGFVQNTLGGFLGFSSTFCGVFSMTFKYLALVQVLVFNTANFEAHCFGTVYKLLSFCV